MATYFITGISGFLGSNLVQAIFRFDSKAKIIGLAFPNNPCPYINKDIVTIVGGDVLNPDSLDAFLSVPAPEGKRYLIHAAGRISVYRKNDPLTTKVNVEGTRNVLEAAKRHRIDAFLFLSSVDALSKVDKGKPIVEQSRFDETGLEGVYSISKAIASNLVLDANSPTMATYVVQPSAILGPLDPGHNPINEAIKRFLNGKLPAVVKGAYDLVDVRDVAEGILLVLEKGTPGESYLLTGNHAEVIELIACAARHSGKKPIKLKVPTFLIKLASPFIEAAARRKGKGPLFTSFAVDCLQQNSDYHHEKATALGYRPRSLDETMEDTVTWMKESGYLDK